MSDYVIVIPKQDEFIAVQWAFETQFLEGPDERTPTGVELYRRQTPVGALTFALLDKQTNTYSSLLTHDIISRESPRLIFLVGTAMGKQRRVAIGSAVASDGIIDISEKRYTDNGRATYVPRGPTRSDEIVLDAKDFISRQFLQETAHRQLRSMARRPALNAMWFGMIRFM
jgi:hypothetical protein